MVTGRSARLFELIRFPSMFACVTISCSQCTSNLPFSYFNISYVHKGTRQLDLVWFCLDKKCFWCSTQVWFHPKEDHFWLELVSNCGCNLLKIRFLAEFTKRRRPSPCKHKVTQHIQSKTRKILKPTGSFSVWAGFWSRLCINITA